MKIFTRLDENITEKIRIYNVKSLYFRFAAFLSHTGDSWLWCGALFLIWIFSSGNLQRLTAFWGGSIAVTAAVIFLLKHVIHRRRPEGSWGELYRKYDPHSFPSGHAVRAGLILALAFSTFSFPLTAIFLLWALAMIFSRVVTGVHYFFDITAGFLLGILIGIGWIKLQPFLFDSFAFLFDRSQWLELIRNI